jgi:hypothetical protein
MLCTEIVKYAKWNMIIITGYNIVRNVFGTQGIERASFFIFCKREYNVSTISGKMKG